MRKKKEKSWLKIIISWQKNEISLRSSVLKGESRTCESKSWFFLLWIKLNLLNLHIIYSLIFFLYWGITNNLPQLPLPYIVTLVTETHFLVILQLASLLKRHIFVFFSPNDHLTQMQCFSFFVFFALPNIMSIHCKYKLH